MIVNSLINRKKLSAIFPWLVAVCAILILGALLWLSQKSFNNISDAPEYVVVGKLLLEGKGSKCYDPASIAEVRHKLFPLLKDRSIAVLTPPPGLMLFIPFGLLNEKLLRAFYLPFCLLISSISILLLGRTFNLAKRDLLFLFATVAIFWPFFECLRIGQITPVLLFFLSLATFLFRKNSTFRGMLALCVFVIKPHYLLPFVVYLIGARKFKQVIWGATIIAALIAISLMVMGIAGYPSYLEMLFGVSKMHNIMLPQISPTIIGQLLRLPGVSDWTAHVISACCWLLTLLFSFALGERVRDNDIADSSWFTIWLMAVLPLSLITASSCHSYDLALLIPSAVALRVSKLGQNLERYPYLFIAALLYVVLLSIPIACEFHFQMVLNGVPINPFFVLLLIYSLFSAWLGWKEARRDCQQTPCK